MKKQRPIKHTHRKAMIAQRKSKGKYSRQDLPKPESCFRIKWCEKCWANKKCKKKKKFS